LTATNINVSRCIAIKKETFPVSRHRPGAADGVGNRSPGPKTLPFETRHDAPAQRRFAAEEMRAARNIEQEPIRRIETDQRRVTVAPVGDGDERAPVGLRIGVGDSDAREHRARVGERHAGSQSEMRRRIVHRGEPQCTLDRLDDGQRLAIRRVRAAADVLRWRVSTRQTIRHQPSQPHRQIAFAGGRRAHDDPNTR
jgi:hypothetical protein